MRLIREFPLAGKEIMLDIGNLEWVTVYIVGSHAWILPTNKPATSILLENMSKRKEVDMFLIDAYCVSTISYPCTRKER